jgi:phosphoribosylamine---glycine ligase
MVVGGGGREHALAIALSRDPAVSEIVAAPGNPGMAALAELSPVDPLDPQAVAALAKQARADLVVVGPEAPLIAGVTDAVRAAGVACFGPSAAAARLEGSKAFAKEVMAAAGVATARSRICRTSTEVVAALDEFGPPFVVKKDGLAAGKGVLVTDCREAAMAHAMVSGHVVVEEYLDGPEVSLLVITDGATVLPLLPAQDYKRLEDGDRGPNTGGMGAYAPLDGLPDDLVNSTLSGVVAPVLAEMSARGAPFAGVLYVGLALTARGPKVVEFNARFGDPEAQVILPLLDAGLGVLLHAAATNALERHPPLAWRPAAAVTVVIAPDGYPDAPRAGDKIVGADGPGYLHAGTRRTEGGDLVTAGGRALCCTAVADTVAAAREEAYALVDRVALKGARYRTDIALL